MCLLVITKAAFWMFDCMSACIFRIRCLWRKSTEWERTKEGLAGLGWGGRRGGGGKCRLFVTVHMARLTSNTSISYGLHLSCRTLRSRYVGSKEKSYGNGRTRWMMFSGAAGFVSRQRKEGSVSDVVRLLYTWLLAGK